jgi:hypothetical protein
MSTSWRVRIAVSFASRRCSGGSFALIAPMTLAYWS